MSFVYLTDSSVNQVIGVGEYGLIGQNATLASASLTAVQLSDNSSLTAAGTLFSKDVSVLSNATSGAVVTVTLTGSIIAAQAGAIIGGALSDDFRIYNAGFIQSDQSAIEVRNGSFFLTNSGQIMGNDATAVFGGFSGQWKIANTGLIAGREYGIYTADGSISVRLQNDGVVQGGTNALALGSGDDVIFNNGTLTGLVELNDGNDIFRGQGGVQGDVNGGNGNDTILGGRGDDNLLGRAGDDLLSGGDGDDAAFGDAGLDLMTGGDGADSLYGGTDADTMEGGAGLDAMSGGAGNDLMRGGAEDDLINGDTENDTILGGTGDDLAFGGDNNDRLDGNAGDDTLDGGLGVDVLFGGFGADSLLGGSNIDTLDGGAGDDLLSGGASADMFVFARGGGNDRVTDFANNVDKLDLRALDFASVAAVVAASSDSALGLLINLATVGGGSILLSGFTLANLDATDLLI